MRSRVEGEPAFVVVMGVSGSGKTTVGRALAAELGWRFVEADDLHPAANVAKMRAGRALDEDDRRPWLERVAAELRGLAERGEHAVVACSALRESHRERLRRAAPVRFVHLTGDAATIAARLATRRHAFMPAELLESQLTALEPPADAIEVDVALPVAAQVARIRTSLGRGQDTSSTTP